MELKILYVINCKTNNVLIIINNFFITNDTNSYVTHHMSNSNANSVDNSPKDTKNMG